MCGERILLRLQLCRCGRAFQPAHTQAHTEKKCARCRPRGAQHGNCMAVCLHNYKGPDVVARASSWEYPEPSESSSRLANIFSVDVVSPFVGSKSPTSAPVAHCLDIGGARRNRRQCTCASMELARVHVTPQVPHRVRAQCKAPHQQH